MQDCVSVDHPRRLCVRPSISQYFDSHMFPPTEANSYSSGDRQRLEMYVVGRDAMHRYSKAKAYHTCIAPQAAYHSFSSAVHVTDRAGIPPMGRRLSLRPQTLTRNQTATRSPGLPFNGLMS